MLIRKYCKMLKVNNPILTNVDLLKIKNMKQDGFKIAEIPTIYYKNSSLEKAMDYLFIEVDRAIRDGANILMYFSWLSGLKNDCNGSSLLRAHQMLLQSGQCQK